MNKKINYYTDGACSTNGTWNGGAGLFVELENSKEHYYFSALETTNNIMELEALKQALKHAIYNSKAEDEINIHSDSAYVLNTLIKGWYLGWEKNGWKDRKSVV